MKTEEKSDQNQNRYMSGRDLARYLGVSQKFISKHVASGKIPGIVRLGRLIRFDREQIELRLLSCNLLFDNK